MSLHSFLRRLGSRRVLSHRKRESRSARPRLEELETRCLLTEFVVTDPGGCEVWLSLGAQINSANGNPGLDTIVFNIPANCAVDGIYTLTPESQLPAITDPVIIDGTSQAGFAQGHPVVALDGSQAGGANGLEFKVGGNTVKGLIIHSFAFDGIVLAEPGSENPTGGNMIQGNFIGTDASGKVARGNSAGIHLVHSPNNTIGGRTEADRNLISGNRQSGIFVADKFSTDNHVEGNFIGTDITGLNRLGNGLDGVFLGAPENRVESDGFASGNFIGAPDSNARNVIAGNTNNGINILRGTGNMVQGNYIGVGVDGVTPVPNGLQGVLIEEGIENVIGGTLSAAGNVISSNRSTGIKILATSKNALDNRVQSNLIGTNKDGAFGPGLGNRLNGIELRNDSSDESVIVSGNRVGDEDGVVEDGTLNAGNVISANVENGIVLVGARVSFNLIRGNFIGTAADGNAELGNRANGMLIDDASDNTIDANTICQNSDAGVRVQGEQAMQNKFINNQVCANLNGIEIADGASHNFVGMPAGGNFIVKNRASGVAIFGDGTRFNVVERNAIGISDMDEPQGNGLAGVIVSGNASNNFIGGSTLDSGNVISANQAGVVINLQAHNNTVSFNRFGTTLDGSIQDDLGNILEAVFISGSGNTIGGVPDTTTETFGNIILSSQGPGVVITSVDAQSNTIGGNVIGRNLQGGILIADGASDNHIENNDIGIDRDETPLANVRCGISIVDSPKNWIGGTDAATGNRVGFTATDPEVDVLDGCSGGGISIRGRNSSENHVQFNQVFRNESAGLEVAGAASHNFIGGSEPGVYNGLALNEANGVVILGEDTSFNVVQGNLIGINFDNEAVGNSFAGVLVAGGAHHNQIGGSEPGARNVISANEQGVEIVEASHDNEVVGNFIGTDLTGSFKEDLGNTAVGVIITASRGNLIGGERAPDGLGLGNTILGNGIGVAIRRVDAQSNTIRGNVIGRNLQGGVLIADGASDNHIENNDIGVDRDQDALPNVRCGISIVDSPKNWIGGTDDTTGNRIGNTAADPKVNVLNGCSGAGISIRGRNSSENHVQFNQVFRNDLAGLEIADGASHNFIGGSAPGVYNGFGLNKGNGVAIFGGDTSFNVVQGNLIGINFDSTGIGNRFAGVFVSDGAHHNQIGGSVPGSRNVISANDQGVLILAASHDNEVVGNFIGTDLTGSFQENLGNADVGIGISDSRGNLIGGETASVGIGLGNTILGNGIGVGISGANAGENIVQGNLIARNEGHGVAFTNDASGNQVGGPKKKDANRISQNGKAGVFVESGTGNAILHNQIFDNGGLGIDLAPEGVTVNDSRQNKDSDFGPNNLQNFPTLDFATTGGSHRIVGTLNSASTTTYLLQFFATAECDPSGFGEGSRFVTSKSFTTNNSGVAFFDVSLPESEAAPTRLTAAATDLNGNTSEFSKCVRIEVDSDGDGISDADEIGDGNNDQVPDKDQAPVASFRNAVNGAQVTLVAPAGARLTNVRPLENPSPDDAPPHVEFGVGFVDFAVTGLAPGAPIDVTMILPAGSDPHFYFRYGPTPDNPNPHWYDWLFDGQTGAEINGNRIALHFVDGRRGDDDLAANGIIVDAGGPGFPDEFTVINTLDSGDGSLRQAILNANANPGLDEITFSIRDPGPLSIRPLSALPAITDSVVIDGSTQPGFSGTPIIELDGSLAGPAVNGLTLAVIPGESNEDDGELESSIISGLVINRFSASGIRIESVGNHIIEGNFIGTDVTGTIALGNGFFGVEIDDTADNYIGGFEPSARNVISGNAAGGIFIHGRDATSNLVISNLIGTGLDGASPLGNGGPGVLVDSDASFNTVGFFDGDTDNTIAFNAGAGVLIRSGQSNTIQENSIFGNGGLGIDLGGDGVTANDADDSDAGGNDLLNFPVLTRVASYGGRTYVAGTLTSTPNSSFTIEFFASSAADPFGFGEGQTFVGSTDVVTDSTGQAAFDVSFMQAVLPGSVFTATATNGSRNTSEFSFGLLVPVTPLLTFTVNTTDDVDDGVADESHTSLREAIRAANARAGADTIRFNIPGQDRTIAPLSPLPEITDPVTIDGTTQRGFAGLPLVELDGTQAGVGAGGLRITGGGSVVRGLVINRFDYGIVLENFGGNRVEGNFLGTDVTGTSALPRQLAGVFVNESPDNRIGGTTPASRNVILTVWLIGNGARGNRVQGNYINTDVTGSALLPGSFIRGVDIQGPSNTIGGTEPGAGNVIATGIGIFRGSGNVVQGNLIGTDATGTSFLPGRNAQGIYVSGRVELDSFAANNLIGGTTPAARNIIAAGVSLGGFAFGNRVQGNYIGTDITGTVAFRDAKIGIFDSILGSGVNIAGSGNTVGGTTPGAGNLISGNPVAGLLIEGSAAGNAIQGNRIGTDVTGTKSLGNQVGIVSAGSSNVIGGSIPGAGNLISGNDRDGLRLVGFGFNVVQGNFIGTDYTGTVALGNGTISGDGVFVGENSDTIGGSDPGAGNVISGNGGNGIAVGVSGIVPSGTVIQGNFIGTDLTGTSPLGNTGAGISIQGSRNNRIGGPESGAGNVISANQGGGLKFYDFTAQFPSTGNTVQGNQIGTDVTGTRDLGNVGDGVSIVSSSFVAGNNAIGGTDPAAGNVIAFNTGHGVSARFSSRNSIRDNSIFANGGLGIVVSINDVMSSYAEVRGAILSGGGIPVLTSALFDPQGTILKATLAGMPFTRYALDVFANDAFDPSGFGEGQTFIESLTLLTDETGLAQLRLPLEVAVPVGRWITATATDPAGNTSQFSRPIPVVAAVDPNTVQFGAPAYLVSENGGEAVVVVTRTGSTAGTVTVDFATAAGSAMPGADYAAASGTLTFHDGESSKTITIPIQDDAFNEGDETFRITLSNPAGVSLGTLSDAIVTIADNDAAGKLDFAVSALSISEGQQPRLLVTRSDGSSGRITVDYRVTGGSATPCFFSGLAGENCDNKDYFDLFGSLTFEDGQTTGEIILTTFDDSLSVGGGVFEGPETIEVTLGNPSGGAVLGAVTQTVLTLQDDDDLHGGFRFSVGSGGGVPENAGSITLVVIRTGITNETVSVDFATRDITAQAGSDYTATSGTLTFSPGQTSKVLSIPIREDVSVEDQETFEVLLSNPTGGAIVVAGADRAEFSIIDNDSPGRFVLPPSTLEAPGTKVHENAGTALVTVARRDGARGVARVNFATSDGSATAGSDYTPTSGTLTFNDGETAKTIAVPILRDTLIEGDETFFVTLSDPTDGASIGTDNPTVVTIFETAGEFEFSTARAFVAESNAGFTVTITLVRFTDPKRAADPNGRLPAPVTVDYMIGDGTARDGADYSAITGTLTFAPFIETRKTITIPLFNDALLEDDETIFLTLSNAAGGVGFGARAAATLTILDEDSDRPPPNQEPVANPDAATTDEGAAVTKNVLANDTDEDGDTLAVSAFDATSARGGTVSCTTSGDCTYTPSGGITGTDTFRYTASDGRGGTTAATVTVTVRNVPPTITAVTNSGPITEGASATITVTAIDPAGLNDPLRFEFDCDNDGVYEIGPQSSNSATCTFADNGTFPVSVRVTDGDGGVDADSTTVTVQNLPPTITAVTNSGPITEGASVTITVTAIDPAGLNDPLRYEFDCDNDGVFEIGPQSDNSATCTFADNGTFPVVVRVFDGDGGADTDSTTVTVQNLPPTITAVTNSGPITEGSSVTITVTASDPAGVNDPLRYEFDCDNNGVFEIGPQSSNSASCTFGSFGSFTVPVRVTDLDEAFAADRATIAVIERAVNNPPSFTAGPNQLVRAGTNGQVVVEWATDVLAGLPNEAGQELEFLVTNDSPLLFAVQPRVAPNGTLTFTPAANVRGVASVTVQLHDDGGTQGGGQDSSITATFTITVLANGSQCTVARPVAEPAATGNVRARMAKGTLSLIGDRSNNSVTISAGAQPGFVRLSGVDTTAVNGRSAPIEFGPVTQAIRVQLGGGNDNLIIDGTVGTLIVPGRLIVNDSAGDSVFFNRFDVRRTPPDNDAVAIIDSLLESGLSVRLRAGSDTVGLCGSTSNGPVRVQTGRGPDTVLINDSTIHDLTQLNTGRGPDVVAVESAGDPLATPTVFHRCVRVKTGRGNDSITLGTPIGPGNSVQTLGCTKVRGGRGTDRLNAGLAGDPNANGNGFTQPPDIHGIEQHMS